MPRTLATLHGGKRRNLRETVLILPRNAPIIVIVNIYYYYYYYIKFQIEAALFMLRIDKAPIPNINFPMPFKPFEHMALTHPQSCCGSKKEKQIVLKKANQFADKKISTAHPMWVESRKEPIPQGFFFFFPRIRNG